LHSLTKTSHLLGSLLQTSPIILPFSRIKFSRLATTHVTEHKLSWVQLAKICSLQG